MKHIIIGTAGHVDHGKTALIKALTGLETDRLREEKERGISIELGFAYLTFPSGRKAGIVDVPGHEKFIKQMLAGVSGIDLVLLVIAADEGVMPQTREHLDILHLLQVKSGIVVLTKTDLVEEDWLELVQEEVREFLLGTVLEKSPILSVSSTTGKGITELLQVIDKNVTDIEQRPDEGSMRLPIDRIFSITGFGTVVTGTLVSGGLSVGDEVVIMPSEITCRVRGIQIHGEKVETSHAGQRTAVNLAGIEVAEIQRGDVLTVAGTMMPAFRLDVKFHMLSSATKNLKNRERIRLHIGTNEIIGRVILLDRDELKPGEETYIQLQLEAVAVAGKGDHFVIRTYSPMHTIGGGTVIDANSDKHKRFDLAITAQLQTKEKGTPEEQVEQYLQAQKTPSSVAEVELATHLKGKKLEQAIDLLSENKKIKILFIDNKSMIVFAPTYYHWAQEITNILSKFHQRYPLRQGVSKEEIRSKIFGNQNVKAFQSLLQEMVAEGLIKTAAQTACLPTHIAEPVGKDAEIVGTILDNLNSNQFQPPLWKEISSQLRLGSDNGVEYLDYLLHQKKIVKVADEIYFTMEMILQVKEKIFEYLKEHECIRISDVRDLLGTSRKYVLPLMEYLDQQRFTRRIEDKRVLGAKAH